MPKTKKGSAETEAVQDMQKLYAHAYAMRLAKQVAAEVIGSHRKATGHKKIDGTG
jgi:hypothetical protein